MSEGKFRNKALTMDRRTAAYLAYVGWFARIPACTSTFPKEAREYLDKCKTTGEYMPTVASLTVDSQNPWQLPADDLKVWIKLPLPNRLQSMLRSGVMLVQMMNDIHVKCVKNEPLISTYHKSAVNRAYAVENVSKATLAATAMGVKEACKIDSIELANEDEVISQRVVWWLYDLYCAFRSKCVHPEQLPPWDYQNETVFIDPKEAKKVYSMFNTSDASPGGSGKTTDKLRLPEGFLVELKAAEISPPSSTESSPPTVVDVKSEENVVAPAVTMMEPVVEHSEATSPAEPEVASQPSKERHVTMAEPHDDIERDDDEYDEIYEHEDVVQVQVQQSKTPSVVRVLSQLLFVVASVYVMLSRVDNGHGYIRTA